MYTRHRIMAFATACFIAVPVLLSLPRAGWAQIEEMVVTTRRREENLQNVPIAVTAISSEQIERQGISDLADVVKLTPSVTFDTSFNSSDTRVTIRGLVNTRGRSNVAFLVDGIDVTTENMISAGSGLLANRRLLNDVERVEVIKGSQSALYGRAAFSGAISYVTKEPGQVFDGQVRIDAAEDGLYEVSGAAGGPVFDDLFGLRLNGVYWNDDGRYTNAVSGASVGGGDGYGGALVGVFTPTETIRIKARAEYSDDHYDLSATSRLRMDTPLPYPQEALDAGLGFGSNASTGLVDHGLYCAEVLPSNLTQVDERQRALKEIFPDYPTDPDTLLSDGTPAPVPGFCVPSTYGSGAEKEVRLSENGLTGSDPAGTDLETFRASLLASWDLDFGSFSWNSGWTDADSTQILDQGYQASGRPDDSNAGWTSDVDKGTTQLSSELRFASAWDGPLQLTVGALYWDEERSASERGYLISCLTTGKLGVVITDLQGLCDGNDSRAGAGISVDSWQQYALQLQPQAPVPWSADTNHKSVYAMLEWSMTDQWTFTFEDRYVKEDFDITKPNFSTCANLAFGIGGTSGSNSVVLPFLDEAENPGFDALCASDDPDGQDQNGNPWMLISGSESSDYHTPKITVEWTAAENSMLYFSWAKARKPAGISGVLSGGAAVTIDDERFLSEKMETFELGTKTSWEVAGYLQLNGAIFFEDFTDKQVNTQVLVPLEGGGFQANPRIVNASAAEIWGLELEAIWQPSFFEGLSLGASYTYLDTTYADFVDETGSLVRASMSGTCPVVWRDSNTNAVVATGPDNPNADPDEPTAIAKCAVSLTGNDLERTPENAFVGQINVERPFRDAGFDWYAGLNLIYQDERWADFDNYIKLDSFWLIDVRLGLASNAWDVQFYVDNLFDDDTMKTGGNSPDFGPLMADLGFSAGLVQTHYFGPLPDPRRVGVRMTYRF